MSMNSGSALTSFYDRLLFRFDDVAVSSVFFSTNIFFFDGEGEYLGSKDLGQTLGKQTWELDSQLFHKRLQISSCKKV